MNNILRKIGMRAAPAAAAVMIAMSGIMPVYAASGTGQPAAQASTGQALSSSTLEAQSGSNVAEDADLPPLGTTQNTTKQGKTTTTMTTTITDQDVLPEDHVWIRAKISYVMDDVLKGVDDNSVTFADGWTKSGDWYYYKDPVESGDTLTFIKGVKFPTEWGNETAEHDFDIIVIVECAEVVTGDTGWDANTDVTYSQTFSIWKKNYQDQGKLQQNQYIHAGTIKAVVNEYQLDDNGKEIAYQNDKMIVPGQRVDKIVKITIQGNKGSIVQRLINSVISRRTGDASHIVLYSGIAAVAVIAIVVITRRSKAKSAVHSGGKPEL